MLRTDSRSCCQCLIGTLPISSSHAKQMQRLLKFFKKDAVNTAEDIAEEPQAFVKTASEIQEDDCDDKPTTEVEDTEGKDMTAADQQENDRDSAKVEEAAGNEEQQKQQEQKKQEAEKPHAQIMDFKETTTTNEVCSAASSDKLISPHGDAVYGSAVSEDLQTTATASTNSGSGSIITSSSKGVGVVNGEVGGSNSVSVSDSCSWETKTKDAGKVAENGDTARINAKAEESGCDLALKLGKPEVIHPLQNSWGIWCFMQNRSQDWHENVRHISNFSSVEDFWSLFNHIQTVDNLPVGCDYYIFKASIQPMWEDRANINGGRWLLKVPHSHPTFVQLWIETLLLLVGEAFESESESVCGAVAQVRRGFNKISIWTRDAANRGACMRIGYRWKACLKAAAPIHYEAHLEVNRKNGRRSKSVYSIN
ncbi:hypothetical protein BOX15_Mlig016507g2 [Macrostomum lignano]|uniref:EIF-4F 25 kDa subunit n=1 Tax=Macrostomum lignano TaxID=282301 RepID=A0A267FZS6_9PLAT|nr:hypothetical protein BOX15_Mlig016507g2 [Macrostomum lignano]